MKPNQIIGFLLVATVASIVAGVVLLAGAAWGLITFGTLCGSLFIMATRRGKPHVT